jgi:hypothetical protein
VQHAVAPAGAIPNLMRQHRFSLPRKLDGMRKYAGAHQRPRGASRQPAATYLKCVFCSLPMPDGVGVFRRQPFQLHATHTPHGCAHTNLGRKQASVACTAISTDGRMYGGDTASAAQSNAAVTVPVCAGMQSLAAISSHEGCLHHASRGGAAVQGNASATCCRHVIAGTYSRRPTSPTTAGHPHAEQTGRNAQA